MKKVLIAVDDTKGSKAVLSVFKNLVRPPQEVLLLHVQRLEGKSLMIDMLGEAELSTLRESLKALSIRKSLTGNRSRFSATTRGRLRTAG